MNLPTESGAPGLPGPGDAQSNDATLDNASVSHAPVSGNADPAEAVELTLLGCILREPSCLTEVRTILPDTSAFGGGEQERTYGIMLDLHKVGRTITEDLLLGELDRTGDINPARTLADIKAHAPSRKGVDFNKAASSRARQLLRIASERDAEMKAARLEFEVQRMAGRVKVTLTTRLVDEVIHADCLDLSSDKARQAYAMAVAHKSGAKLALIDARLLELASGPVPQQQPSNITASRSKLLADKDTAVAARLAETPGEVLHDARALLLDPLLLNRIADDLERIGIAGERPLAITCYLIGTSRLLPKPLAGLIQGMSSSGKSYVPDKVSGLFPQEAVLKAHGISAQAIQYATPGSLIHRWVVAGERSRQQDEAQADATKAQREILAAGELNKLVSEKGSDGKHTSRHVVQHGPIAYTESTTNARVFDEDFNRMLPLCSDESPAQTARVIAAQAAHAAGMKSDTAQIVAIHQAAQRLLKRVIVEIPFANALAAAIPKSKPEARRAFPHLLSMIEAVALLHQYQRIATPDHGVTIRATKTDYAVALELLAGPLGRALGEGLPNAVVNFGKALHTRFGLNVFTTTETRQGDVTVKSKSKVNEYLGALVDAGFVERVEESKGRNAAKWRFVAEVTETAATWLPDLDAPKEATQ